jgi:hypothetical protein
LGACSKASEADQLVDRSVAHLEAGVAMMRAAGGDPMKLTEAALQYRMQHRDELVTLRTRGEVVLQGLADEERRKVETRAKNLTTPLVAQMEAEARKFPEPKLALRLVRPLIVPAVSRPGPPGKLPWLPEVPELPPELMGMGGHGAGDGHDHGPLPPLGMPPTPTTGR